MNFLAGSQHPGNIQMETMLRKQQEELGMMPMPQQAPQQGAQGPYNGLALPQGYQTPSQANPVEIQALQAAHIPYGAEGYTSPIGTGYTPPAEQDSEEEAAAEAEPELNWLQQWQQRQNQQQQIYNPYIETNWTSDRK